MFKQSPMKALLVGSSLSAMTIATPALAQIEEIFVTAEKRVESVRDVSLSVVALSSDSLRNAGINDVSRVEQLVSGVNFAFIGNDAKFNVRGANSNNTFSDNSSIVGAFVDGVYRPRASQQTRAFFDVDRLEFLKGPQGTLYGRNTFAGALNLYTNRPDLDETAGGIDITYSSFDKLRTEGFVNVPVSDTLAVRIAGLRETSDGYIDNTAGPRLAADDDFAIRGSVYWEATDALDVTFRYTYVREEGTTAGTFSYTGLCRPVNEAGRTDALGGLLDCANPRRGSDGLPSFANQDPYTVEQDFVPNADLNEHSAALELNYDFGPVTLKSITSYTDYSSLIGADGDASGNPFERLWFLEETESITQEIQISSQYDSPLQWTAGVYASKDEQFFSFLDFRETQDDQSMVPDGLLLGTPLVSRDIFLNGFFADATAIDTVTLGVFAQGEYAFSDQLRIIGGVRYNYEDKELFGGGSNFTANGPVLVAFETGDSPRLVPQSPFDVFSYDLDAPGAVTLEDTFKRVTWRAGLEFDVTDDIMLYFTSSTGFLSGALNRNGSITDQQTSIVYEAGAKSLLLDGTLQLNVAVHRTNYSNLLSQVQATDPATGNVITFSENGGDIKATGAEIEAVWAPIDNLQFNLTAAYLDSEFGTFGVGNPYQDFGGQPVSVDNPLTPLGFIDLAGAQTPWSPEFTLNLGAAYTFDLGDKGTVTPRVNFFYSDGYSVSGILPIDPAARQDSYTKTDLRLSWSSAEGQYGVEVFVENIEDEAVNARANIGGNDFLQTSFLYPRNFGIRVRAGF